VLKDINLSVRQGERIVLCGPSGSGKSTPIRCLNRLEEHQQGRIVINGVELTSDLKQIEAIRREVGMVFQGFNLFPALTALEQVQLPLGYRGMRNRDSEPLARQALDEVGLSHRSHMRPAQLSGGEKQRVAVARAFAKSPTLIFADEPTSALDAENGQRVIDILHRYARAHGATVLCVSHDPRLIRHADRVIAMEDGTVRDDRRQNETVESAP